MLPVGAETKWNAQPKWRSELKGGKLMKCLLKRVTLLTVVVLLGAAAASFGGGVPAAVHYIGHEKVTATMAKGGAIVSDPGLIVLANRREAGPVEYHDRTNHVFIMVEGEATFITGGTMVDVKRTAPDQGRRHYHSGEDAALVQGCSDENGCLLRSEHRE
jgi:hypothetical protein